jgi:hypothetical protein
VKIASPVTAVVLLTAATHVEFESPLPTWEGKPRAELEKEGWIPGAFLLTDDPIPGETEKTAFSPLELEPPTAGDIAGDNTLYPEVPGKFLKDYFAERPKGFLVDPQGLLNSNDHRDRMAFLNYHASDSSIDLFVYLFDGNQEIPSEVRDEEMAERLFSDGRPAVIVFYYLGAPQRSTVSLSPSLTDSIPSSEQYRALESSIMQAVERSRTDVNSHLLDGTDAVWNGGRFCQYDSHVGSWKSEDVGNTAA